MLSTIVKLLKWTKGYHKRIYIGVLLSFLHTWTVAMPILIAAFMIDKVLADYQGNYTLVQQDILVAFLLMVVAIFLRFVLSYAKARLQESIGTEIAAKERIEIGEVLKRVSLGYFSKNNTGSIVSTVTNELSSLELNATKMVETIMNGYANLVAIIISITIFCWPAGIVAIIGSILSYLLLENMNTYSNKMAVVSNNVLESMAAAIIEYIRGVPLVKSYGNQGVAMENLRNACKYSKDTNIQINRDFAPRNCFHIFVLKVTIILIVLIATYFTFIGDIEVAYFILLSMFAFMMFDRIEGLSDTAHILGVLDKALLKLDEMKNVTNIDEDGKEITLSEYDIAFKNVSFAYDKENTLQDISFTIPEKTVTAIIGPSGSGKTTICSLIARFYDVQTGSIEVGGNNVKEFTCDSLLQNISMVFQNVYLFKDTIYNNIQFGKASATKEEIVIAAKKARCHDFIMELPQQYDTLIGEGGATLSGGEKQRISIARAMLKDAPIIILDEATASIDPENEQLVQQAIEKLVIGKTVIIIAHRLATIEKADQILVIDNGKLVQRGKHHQLLEQEGIYKDFIAIRKQSESWNI